MASLYDVAKQAGVSKTLVSRVINNQKGVSPLSKEKILQAMKDLNYTPNALARSLVLQKTLIIGVVLDNLCDTFYFDLILGIEHQIDKSDFDVLFCSGRNKEKLKNKYINFFSQGRGDGIIIYGSSLNDESLIQQLSVSKFPFVVVENEIPGLDINNIVLDNQYGSKLAVEHLIECGCKTIYHITGDLTVNAAIDRKYGYIKAMEERNFKVQADMIYEGGFTIDSGYQAVKEMMAGKAGLPDAIYFGADTAAFGGMMALKEAGVSVPEDIMIVGFDDDKPQKVEVELKKLTTLRQPLYQMGIAAVELLINDIESRVEPKQKQVYYPELIVRETTMRKIK